MRRVVPRSAVILVAAATSIASVQPAGAQNLFEMLFGGGAKQQPQQQQRQQPAQPPADNPVANFFADPFGLNGQQQQQQQGSQRASVSSGGGPGFCVRTCDGRYFPLARGTASPAQMCQAFCPAAVTKVYYGGTIDDAAEAGGERYADSGTAFAFRKALKADCTCNGKSPAGLASVDLSLDSSLRPGDVVATANGLAAYAGNRGGGSLDFTPVASYPGLTADVRSRLGEMKVSPATDEPAFVAPQAATNPAPARAVASPKARRAAVEPALAAAR